MKILAIHADYIKFKALKKALKDAPEASKDQVEVKDCLVVFTSVEKGDEKNKEATVERLVHEIRGISVQVKEKNIIEAPQLEAKEEAKAPEAKEDNTTSLNSP